MSNKRKGILVYALLFSAAFSFRLAVARFLPNDDPFDGKVYAQIARNVLEQHSYSHATEPPYEPTLIRLPGYPLFIAGVYYVFGHGNDTAVRMLQAFLDTITCVLIAILAFLWDPEPERKRRSAIFALALAALCPFTTIYVATILTETGTILLAVAMCLTATLAFTTTNQLKAALLWAATGLLAGLAVLFRPDSGLFALAVGLTLVVTTFLHSSGLQLSRKRDEGLYRFARASYLGAVFSLAFCLALVPWTVRNSREFHLFQPLAPAHAEMPGEFVPRGYLSWLRTWIDDGRYIGPVLWSLDESPIKTDEMPERAFDSVEEKQRVAALLERYNHPPEEPEPSSSEPENTGENQPSDRPADARPGASPEVSSAAGRAQTEADESSDESASDGGDAGERDDEADPADGADESALDQSVEMTPEIDAGFAQLAKERITRHPVRYYFLLPVRRAAALWFDTHSQYYPFEGELLPIRNLNYDARQQVWLPLFAGLTLLYTLVGILGGRSLWQSKQFDARRWLLLVTLLIFIRIGFFATLENPEPRYTVEVFPFLSILGGIGMTRLWPELIARFGKQK